MTDTDAALILSEPFTYSDDLVREARVHTAGGSDEYIAKLYKFYEVSDLPSLVKAQEAHIIRVQQSVDQLRLANPMRIYGPCTSRFVG